MIKPSGSLAVLLLLAPLGQGLALQQQAAAADQARLAEILERTAAYCEQVKGMAFNFFCTEKIEEVTYSFKRRYVRKTTGTVTDPTSGRAVSAEAMGNEPILELENRRIATHSLVYDYQMVKADETIIEQRRLLEENGQKKDEADTRLKTARMQSKYLVFGPVGFLSRSWQKDFSYSILGREQLEGREAVVIRAVPRSERKDNYNFGRIWVDSGDFSIRKIEWEPASLKNLQDELTSSIGDLRRRVTWTVAYGVEKNGVRFPSRQVMEEIYITPSGKETPKYRAVFDYGEYKFFTVGVNVSEEKIIKSPGIPDSTGVF